VAGVSTTYGYVRVSTDDQTLSVEAQSANILARYPDAVIITDVGVSGATPLSERPGFASIQFEPGDQLVAIRLDRIARSTIEASMLLDTFAKDEVNLVLFDLGLDLSSPTGRLVYDILAAIASFERAMIAERTREALFAKRIPAVEDAISAIPSSIPSRDAVKLLMAQGFVVSASTVQRRRKVLSS
jgi:DNA invertase Pin-like site-specific DNA recombinase